MSRISRQILIGALTVILLSSACGRLTLASPTPVWTVPPAGQPVFPTTTLLAPAAAVGTSLTPQIPNTGGNAVSLQCEFCVAAEAHAVLIFPDFASFDVSSSTPVSCFTADVTGGRRILICHGRQSTTFNLNVCSDPSNCLQFPVALQPCPLLQAGATPLATNSPFVPFYPTPTKKSTQRANTAVPSITPTPGGVSSTSTPPTLTIPTSTPQPPAPSTTPTSASYARDFLADAGVWIK
jgi:hypothetical protein